MRCTLEEAEFVFRKWYEESTPLSLRLQLGSDTDPIRLRGQIDEVRFGELRFTNIVMSVNIRFDEMEFEYGECSRSSTDRPSQITMHMPTQRKFAADNLFLRSETVLQIEDLSF